MKTVGDPLQHHSTWHQHQHHHRHHQHHQPTPYQGEARSRMVGPELSVSSTIYSGGVGGEIITTFCGQVGLAFLHRHSDDLESDVFSYFESLGLLQSALALVWAADVMPADDHMP